GDLLRLRSREDNRRLVARLGVTGGEDFSLARQFEDELDRLVAHAPAVGGRADPVVVHVEAERRRRPVAGPASHLARVLGERGPLAAELLRQRQREITGGLQRVEVLLRELVVTVVAGRAVAASLEQRIREDGSGRYTHKSPPKLWGAGS